MYTILTRSQCTFCDSAKAFLDGVGLQHTSYNVQDYQNVWLLDLMKKAGLTTVPQVFSPEGKLIGGYTELKAHLTDGYD